MARLRVLVTGASGFVGRAVSRALVERGYEVVGVSRSGEAAAGVGVRADVFDREKMGRAMEGCGAVVHLVGIIEERPGAGVTFERMHVDATRVVLEAAREAGVRRYVHMSALGTRAGAVSAYHRTKWAGEELVRASGMEWTIFRPSMIHGPDGKFMRMAAGWARGRRAPWVVMPYFAPAHRLQPVFVGDVGRAFAEAVERHGEQARRLHGEVYDLVGPDVYTWPAFLRVVAREVRGREKAALGIPAWYAKLLTRVVPRRLLPFNRDQVVMSQEDNVSGDGLARFVGEFGWEPRALVETLRSYAGQL